jgi:hypothetical protein
MVVSGNGRLGEATLPFLGAPSPRHYSYSVICFSFYLDLRLDLTAFLAARFTGN